MPNKNRFSVKSKKPNTNPNKKYLVVGGLLLVIIIGVAVYLLTRPTGPKEVTSIPTTVTNNQPVSSSQNPTTPTSSKTESSDTTSKIVNLETPSGTFVSSHHISLSQDTSVESTCNTTPGATCTISFTSQDGKVVRYLSGQVADNNGAAYWTWSPKKANLTAGNWQIKATAKSGDQTKTASDPLALEVSL